MSPHISQERDFPILCASEMKCAQHIVEQYCIEKTYGSGPSFLTNRVHSKAQEAEYGNSAFLSLFSE